MKIKNLKYLYLGMSILFLPIYQNCQGGFNSVSQMSQSDNSANTNNAAAGTPNNSQPQPAPAAYSTGDWPPAFVPSSNSACSTPLIGSHQTYDVGPGKAYTELTDVPFMSLVAGDVVNIYYRSTPYRTKFGLRAKGTAAQPVIINGVTDGACNRPVISGDGAVSATDLKTKPISGGIDNLGLILIYRTSTDPDATFSSNPSDTDPSHTYTPQYITIQNLKLTGANETTSFKNPSGVTTKYDPFGGAIYAVRVSHLTVENCEITDTGTGIFVNSKGQSYFDFSDNTIIRRNLIYGNGSVNTETIHNLYIQSRRALYEANYIGHLKLNAPGSTLKDRGSGAVIRYNYIVATARALDLVESEEEYYSNVKADPLYDYAWVYGNTIYDDKDANGGTNPVHWGYDNNVNASHKGTMFFYANTYYLKAKNSFNIQIFQFANNDQNMTIDSKYRIEAFNNIFWNDDGSTSANFMSHLGNVILTGTNFMPANYGLFYNGTGTGTLTTSGSIMLGNPVQGTTTGIVLPSLSTVVLAFPASPYSITPMSLAPLSNSSVIGQAQNIGPSFYPTGVSSDNLKVVGQYTFPIGAKTRTTSNAKFSLGAQEP